MLTPEEARAKRKWEESQLTEDDKLLRRAKARVNSEKRKKLIKERKIINGWNE